MLTLVADRFVAHGAAWLDLATDRLVRLHFAPAGSLDAQLAWEAQCTALAGLRHPLLNPLVDFGALGNDRTFEAYALGDPLRASGQAASRLLTHAVRFLRACDVHLTRPRAGLALRAIASGPPVRGRPLGIALQPRAATAALCDALEPVLPAGLARVRLAGPRQGGLRTAMLLAARAARVRGFVPVSARALRREAVVQALLGRHVCLLHDSDDQDLDHVVAAFLARLGAVSARQHVLICALRPERPAGGAIVLEPLGETAMTRMVYQDPDYGPAERELLAAAARAEGLPGALLAGLGGVEFAVTRSVSLVVHETPLAYGEHEGSSAASRSAGACTDVLVRAPERAARLAASGRHAAAERLLSRALRVLAARGQDARAAQAAQQLGWLALGRANLAAAVRAFEQAREAYPRPEVAVRSALGIGAARIEEGRLVESEAVLRGALVAASMLHDAALSARAAAGLADCLCWQARFDEAAALLATVAQDPGDATPDVEAVAARVALESGDARTAGARARLALAAPVGSGGVRALLAARRASAAVFAAFGDAEHAREQLALALRGAREAHLPLDALRARVALVALAPAPEARARARLLEAAARLPALLRFEIKATLARACGAPLDRETREFIRQSGAAALARPAAPTPHNVLADLESLVELAHSAPDEQGALERVCAELQSRLRAATVLVAAPGERHLIAIIGRPWHGDLSAIEQALAAGLTIPATPQVQPARAAEPVRYGGEVVGVLACRWTAGAPLDADGARAMLRLGALAIAPSVRAVLDRRLPARCAAPSRDDLLGDSAAAQRLRDAAARAARAPFPVLVEGESGSGKELVARAIHRLGPRRDRRFCAVNCAALSDDLLEAELFGHARGAFTGAVGERAGLFEEADGGSLFLDEVAELSPRAQAKLLRVLQDGEVRRVGENLPRHVDVRVIAATNRSLAREVADGRFRADLRYRLDVVRIDVPPLRQRAEDVPILVARFWEEATGRLGSHATLAPEIVAALSRYEWPGNVRELQNVIAWLAVHSPRRGRIGATALPAHIAGAAPPATAPFEAAREEFERRFVRAALATANGQRSRAAEALGVTRQGLAKMIRRLGLESSTAER